MLDLVSTALTVWLISKRKDSLEYRRDKKARSYQGRWRYRTDEIYEKKFKYYPTTLRNLFIITFYIYHLEYNCS